MTRHRPPPQAPPGLWDRPDMAEALDNRDVGAILTIYRRWTGATQTQIAAMTGLPQPTISDVLNGRRQVMKLDVYEKFANGLDIPRGRLGLAEPRPVEPTANVDWLRTRRMLNRHRSELTHLVSKIYPPSLRLEGTGVLMPESWRLQTPVDLCSVELAWQQAPVPAVNGHHAETRPLLPLSSPNRQYTKYHRAMRDLDRPRLFENRPCYRLLGVDPDETGLPGRNQRRTRGVGTAAIPATRLRPVRAVGLPADAVGEYVDDPPQQGGRESTPTSPASISTPASSSSSTAGPSRPRSPNAPTSTKPPARPAGR